jgi:hypothetical protein
MWTTIFSVQSRWLLISSEHTRCSSCSHGAVLSLWHYSCTTNI